MQQVAITARRMIAGHRATPAPISIVAESQCDVSPIAISVQTLAKAVPGTEITKILNGTQPGNFDWLS